MDQCISRNEEQRCAVRIRGWQVQHWTDSRVNGKELEHESYAIVCVHLTVLFSSPKEATAHVLMAMCNMQAEVASWKQREQAHASELQRHVEERQELRQQLKARPTQELVDDLKRQIRMLQVGGWREGGGGGEGVG